ncbi:MAG: TetR/AcrR family transcriptional regulator [Halieaceae bacterium]|nr:TetR/AcrR family transcriptional regulator [Halieaceae bacterium]
MDVAAKTKQKPTPERILDAAENLFAEKGYSSTSLGEVAEEVGIRSPSLYNHFENKQALYSAVMDRLLELFSKPLTELKQEENLTAERLYQWLGNVIRMHHKHPNLSRLLQHAALSDGQQANDLIKRLFSHMFDMNLEKDILPGLGNAELRPWAAVALNNMIMSYITMAPMYRELLGEDPFSPDALEKQTGLIMKLAHLVIQNE